MTRKLARAAGSVSAYTTLLCAVLAILILPVHSIVKPDFHVPQTYVQSDKLNVSSAPSADETVVPSLSQEEEIVVSPLLTSPSDPQKISGATLASPSVYLFGEPEKQAFLEKNQLLFQGPLPESKLNPAPGLFACSYNPTVEEYQMLLYCIDFETRSGCLEHRIMIAEVIMNRVQGPGFGNTLKEILTNPGQFDPMVNWDKRGDWTPLADTVTAANMVLSGCAPDHAQGATYFCNPYIVGEGNWFDKNLQVIREIEGHRFYKPY